MKIFSVLAEFVLWEFSIVSSLSWYSILVEHTCNDHPWLTSETCQCLLAGRKLFSCWICNKSRKITWQNHKVTFSIIQLIWQILKQLSHSGSVNSARYMPWRFASPCIYPPLFTSPRPSRDICILLPLHAETLLRI